MTFRKTDVRFQVKGVLSLTLTPLNEVDMSPSKLYEKACCVKYYFKLVVVNIYNPQVTRPPKPEFSGDWNFRFSGGYLLRIRGTHLGLHLQ